MTAWNLDVNILFRCAQTFRYQTGPPIVGTWSFSHVSIPTHDTKPNLTQSESAEFLYLSFTDITISTYSKFLKGWTHSLSTATRNYKQSSYSCHMGSEKRMGKCVRLDDVVVRLIPTFQYGVINVCVFKATQIYSLTLKWQLLSIIHQLWKEEIAQI